MGDIDDWTITSAGNGTAEFGDDLDYELSLPYRVSHNRIIEATILAPDCKQRVTPDDSVVSITKDVTVTGGPLDDLNLLMDVNITKIQDSNIWEYSDVSNSGTIHMCVKVDLMHETIGSISFHETVMKIMVDMTSNFIVGVDTGEVDRNTEDTKAKTRFDIKSCHCDENAACISNVTIRQNGQLRVCLQPVSDEISVNRVVSFVMHQDGKPKMDAIADGNPNALTSISSKRDATVVATRMVSSFFEGVTTTDVDVTGDLYLGFKNRNLQEGRNLEEQVVGFHVGVQLEPTEVTFRELPKAIQGKGNAGLKAIYIVLPVLAFAVGISFFAWAYHSSRRPKLQKTYEWFVKSASENTEGDGVW
eukprot:CAMPEP_0195524438 /NCGR_PEP_ID=MMETSP0794_2-20130614/24255_1 /TAXON_ID=515487 /ORGANISM="Stephanopyxis turris, Strain CCMP 815" /LENGTH=360 /DNA_ID=CAMNT_0040654653 /DNA_START=92 /DNA_END=1171 /DNA_ORIENTATION=-